VLSRGKLFSHTPYISFQESLLSRGSIYLYDSFVSQTMNASDNRDYGTRNFLYSRSIESQNRWIIGSYNCVFRAYDTECKRELTSYETLLLLIWMFSSRFK